MKILKYVLFTLLLLSCKKENLSPIQLDNVIGYTYKVNRWDFNDLTTGENYNLLEVNDECDTIYLHFTHNRLIVVRVDGRVGASSLYKKIFFDYEFIGDKVYLRRDFYTQWNITTLTDNELKYEGSHDLHQQYQKINISFYKLDRHPEVINNTMGY